MSPIDAGVKEKIKKLLSLGTSDNEHEAALAMKRAAELAEKYGLAISDIHVNTDSTVSVEVMKGSVLATGKSTAVWERGLSGLIARCFDCEVIRVGGWNIENYVFVGTASDIEMAVWYMKVIRLKTIRQGKMKFPLVKDQKMYGIGVVAALRPRLTDLFINEREAIRSANTRDLVVLKKDEVKSKFHEMYPNMRTAAPLNMPKNGNYGAYSEGQKDGRVMVITKQIN